MFMKRRRFTTYGVVAIASLVAVACNSAPPEPTAEQSPTPVTLTVSAAASVQDALAEIQTAYQATSPHVSLVYNFGSSGSLAQQIDQGAPVDMFISAASKWMNDLADKGKLLPGSRQDLLSNELVLIVPKEEKVTVTGFADLSNSAVGKVAIAEPESVPAGTYAKEMLTSLTLWESIQPKLVFGKDVRQTTAYVETGDADAGIVYASDAKVSDRVQVVAIADPATHAPIVYPVAIMQATSHPEAAQAFLGFLTSDTATDIFQTYGFTIPETVQ
jgi:molybdate transport system substrate-binding protein